MMALDEEEALIIALDEEEAPMIALDEEEASMMALDEEEADFVAVEFAPEFLHCLPILTFPESTALLDRNYY